MGHDFDYLFEVRWMFCETRYRYVSVNHQPYYSTIPRTRHPLSPVKCDTGASGELFILVAATAFPPSIVRSPLRRSCRDRANPETTRHEGLSLLIPYTLKTTNDLGRAEPNIIPR